MSNSKVFKFGIRDTPKGAVAWQEGPKTGLREKRFRNGYAGARHSAQKWIDEQISTIRECEEIDGLPTSTIIETHKQTETP